LSAVSVTDSDWQTAGTTRSLDNAAASGGNVHKAGQPFSVSATAVNAAAGVTTNYDGNPAFTITGVLQPALCGACTGTFATGTWSASSGTVSTTTATFDEAGVFTVTLDDQTYADVDIGDSTTAERYVPSAALSVGRFVPDHFDLSASNTPELQTFGVTDAACTTPTAGSKRSFTYIGQPFGYVTVPVVGVTARNAAGATTTNYRSGLWKVVASDVTQTYSSVPASPALAATINSPTVAAGSGTGTVTASSSDSLAYVRDTTAAAAEFSAQITLSVTVQDASESAVSGNGTIGSAAAAVFDGGGTGIAFDSGNAFRYGRLRLSNAHGSELLDLPLPIQTQYFNGSVFVTNSEDNCTTLQASDVKFDFLAGTPNLVACETRMNPTGTITFKSGASSTKLTKPGATNNGAVDLTVNLDALSGNTCVGASSSPATGAGKLYLQGDWGSGTYTEDPKARATFGVYKNADQFIYLRENF
jgi:MSHA biogenesis protein MshQ